MAGEAMKVTTEATPTAIASPKAIVAFAAATTAATSAGPIVRFSSIMTASTEKARRRSSSRVKRFRHNVRVSMLVGEAKRPAQAAAAATAENPPPALVAARTATRESGCTRPVTSRVIFGPERSMKRPCRGAPIAMATK